MTDNEFNDTDKDFRKLEEKLEQAEITMKVEKEEAEKLKLQKVNNVQKQLHI